MEDQKTNAVAERKNMDMDIEIAADAPMNFEGQERPPVDSDSLIIPYLRIGQTSGDFMKRGSSKYIEGLRGGDFFGPLSREVFGDTMRLVVVKYYRNFSVYESKESNAKYLGTITPAQFDRDVRPIGVREKSYTLDKEGHRYVENRNFVVVDYNHPERGPMLASFSSTGTKPANAWYTLLTNVKALKADGSWEDAPYWSSVWEVKTAYNDDPRGGYYQLATTTRLGWVKAGKMADGYRKVYDELNKIDASKISGDADVETETHETSIAPGAAATVDAVFGASAETGRKVDRTPAKNTSSDDEEELF